MSGQSRVLRTAAIESRSIDLSNLPGGELVERGLQDLERGRQSEAALLVAIGATRLRAAGLPVPDAAPAAPEHSLYGLLAESEPDSAHSRYNALIRLLVSFERALESAG